MLDSRAIDTSFQEAEEKDLIVAVKDLQEDHAKALSELKQGKDELARLKREYDEHEAIKDNYDSKKADLTRKVATIVRELETNKKRAAVAKKNQETAAENVARAQAAVDAQSAKHATVLAEAERVTRERVPQWDGQALRIDPKREGTKAKIAMLAEAKSRVLAESE